MMTEDVDAIFPSNPANRALLVSLIKKVGDEMGFATNPRSVWFNDSVSFFGLQTKSEVVVFNHPYPCLKAGKVGRTVGTQSSRVSRRKGHRRCGTPVLTDHGQDARPDIR